MIRGLYTSASGLITRQKQLENLSNDISNINTPGYKSDKTVLKSFQEYLVTNKDKKIGGVNLKNTIGGLEFGVGIDDVKTIFTQGMIEETGRNLDFALDGDGFFTLLDNEDNVRYSRDGRFTINNDGNLVNLAGFKVLGLDSNGNVSPILLNDSDIKISEDGKVSGTDLKLLVNGFENNNVLSKLDSNTFGTTEAPILKTGVKVKQNSLERSNVDSIEIMTEMISISRSFESNQKVLKEMDETLGKTVNEIGSVR